MWLYCYDRNDLALLKVVLYIEKLVKSILVKYAIVYLCLEIVANFYLFVEFICMLVIFQFYAVALYKWDIWLCLPTSVLILWRLYIVLWIFCSRRDFIFPLKHFILITLLLSLSLWFLVLKDIHLKLFFLWHF